jgi:hypothetical protein
MANCLFLVHHVAKAKKVRCRCFPPNAYSRRNVRAGLICSARIPGIEIATRDVLTPNSRCRVGWQIVRRCFSHLGLKHTPESNTEHRRLDCDRGRTGLFAATKRQPLSSVRGAYGPGGMVDEAGCGQLRTPATYLGSNGRQYIELFVS